MQPSPIAETSGPLVPSLRFCIVPPSADRRPAEEARDRLLPDLGQIRHGRVDHAVDHGSRPAGLAESLERYAAGRREPAERAFPFRRHGDHDPRRGLAEQENVWRHVARRP